DSFDIVSGTFQIIWLRLPSWRTWPLTLRTILPLAGCPILLAGVNGPHGAEKSNAFPISHGRFTSREAICRSRRGRAEPTAQTEEPSFAFAPGKFRPPPFNAHPSPTSM